MGSVDQIDALPATAGEVADRARLNCGEAAGQQPSVPPYKSAPDPSTLSGGPELGPLDGKEEVLQEKRRQFRPTAHAGLLVYPERLLAHGPLARSPHLRNLLVAEPLDEQQRDLLLGRGQEPAIELGTHRLTETAQDRLCLCAPAPGIRGGFPEVNPEGGGPTTETPRAYPEEGDASRGGKQDHELARDVQRREAGGPVLQQIGADGDQDGCTSPLVWRW